MTKIASQIDEIIRQRHERLPMIQEQRKFLERLRNGLNSLEMILGQIQTELGCHEGSYYDMIKAHPEMEITLKSVSTQKGYELLERQVRHLDLMEKRFSRESVQIAFIGYERQGKSCFLQSISGLSGKVIPSYSGTSCTGAVSVIHNDPAMADNQVRAEITYFSMSELLENVRAKYEKFFGGCPNLLSSFEDIKKLDLNGFRTYDLTKGAEFGKFKTLVEHIDDYRELIGESNQTIEITDENQIIKQVAQYEEIDGDNGKKNVVHYYNYLAVKSADIYTKFPESECGRIVLVDTIGLGDSSDTSGIEEQMFRVLREDCDAAVDVYMPSPNGASFNSDQLNVLKNITDRLGERDPEKWIVYALNRTPGNANLMNPIKLQINDVFGRMEKKPVAWVKDINALDPNDVKENLMTPLLNMITNNLDDIDTALMDEYNKSGESLFEKILELNNNFSGLVNESQKYGDRYGVFDKLYEDSLQLVGTVWEGKGLKLSNRLGDVYAYVKHDNSEIRNQIMRIIDGFYDLIPSKEAIKHHVERNISNAEGVYKWALDELRNRIYEEFRNFEEVCIQKQLIDVKNKIYHALFDDDWGKLGRIPLAHYSVENGPIVHDRYENKEDYSDDWLFVFAEERVKEKYPELYQVLMNVVKFELDISVVREYYVDRLVESINTMKGKAYIRFNSDLISGFWDLDPVEKHDKIAETIWTYIFNQVVPILQREDKFNVGDPVRYLLEEFPNLPNHAFVGRTETFYDKMIQDHDMLNGQLKDLYRNNMSIIWNKEFAEMQSSENACNAWNGLVMNLSELCSNKEKYFIKIA